jgi:hypothetical protein
MQTLASLNICNNEIRLEVPIKWTRLPDENHNLKVSGQQDLITETTIF